LPKQCYHAIHVTNSVLLCLCDLQEACGPNDPWADYEGVVRGVIEGGCDVGLTKHTTVLEVIQGGTDPAPWATVGAVSGSAVSKLMLLS
jgi:hypothetical protein